MLISKLKIVCAGVVASVLAIGGFHTIARQVGGSDPPRKKGVARPRSNEPQHVLIGTVDRLQADLDKSVLLTRNCRRN